MNIAEINDHVSLRSLQSWVLLLGSLFVTVLVIVDIYLSHSVYYREQILSGNQEMAQVGPFYENALKQLAVSIYHAGPQDPALANVLKIEKITILLGQPTGANSTPSPTAPAPQTSSKPGIAPSRALTP